ncbi:MAG: 3-keto-5-aminohexanoate cleavage protein [Tenericutes bacterium GWC2_34_14]|nr:MAG: 3-keto-5-aminohexanoate cleavage protein [Tenericutes bacterium GWA2_35_7]OHE30042.1 MAG: 3-keto-5-aminohexanoate cleavage protein [Tenericutes bacterium GWC2_34_14]OHE35021.1 MAG: 3-keto-5-aminohexanoate cleavage protein [Tenericutes bacterium GWE2_34_108]OHE37119.1 MAG: 3-keto-5-aminohexanoate cleavage protein [Tenericutes bacterium GWF1_35_14]OHE39749.1 MAG: 3-keto-5-aminohexanoate cleavage protein [Tenericutes bacterium GWF2_35_184]OHE43997.1 MAG: 3-keto-5-aminohexanoate cleavage p
MNKLIITCAISGAEVTKKDNPYVPYTIQEMAEEAYQAYNAGAAIIHLHVRHDDGRPTQSKLRYEKAIKAIKKRCPDVIIQPSTGGAVGMSRDERLKPTLLSPEMCTLDCGTLNFGGDDIFVNTENDIKYFAHRIYEKSIFPELECFEKGHIDLVLRLHKKGFIKTPMHFSFVLGVNGGMTGEERDFHFMRESIPMDATYSVAGIGKYEFSLAELSIKYGGHVRVGLEDNLYLEKGVLAKGNQELVEKVVQIAKSYGREIATPDEARQILGLRRI